MNKWVRSLLHTVISGAAMAGMALYADPQHFNFSPDGFIALGKLAGAGAVLHLLGYLAKSPLPE